MLLEPGKCLLVVHRRLFEKDRSRYFLGRVEAYERGIARVHGFTWAQDSFTGRYVKKHDARCKLISLNTGALFVYVLPDPVDLDHLFFEEDEQGRLWLRDGGDWQMDLTENEHRR